MPRKRPEDNKYSAGSVLVVGGAPGMTGAICLSAAAAFRADAGYVTVAVPEPSLSVVEVRLLEPVKVTWADALTASAKAGAIAIGPGLGRTPEAMSLRDELLAAGEVPIVLDADALHQLEPGDWGARAVLTPHAGELARLLGEESEWVNAHRLEAATRAAERFGCICLLKGADTIIAAPDEGTLVCVVDAPGLATAGTGDVLTGILAAFLAKGVEPRFAAAAAATAHGLAARAAGRQAGTDRERRDRGASVRAFVDGRRHRRLLVHGPGDRRRAPQPRTDGADIDPPRRARRPARGTDRASGASVPRRRGLAPCARRRRHALQHVLGPVRPRRNDIRAGRREHTCAPPCGERRRRPARRPRQRHEPVACSPLPYFRGKAEVERDVEESGLSYAIVRPTLVFGPRDILVNNIAWGLRRSPVFPVAGDGRYRVQPISVEDTATICADAAGGEENVSSTPPARRRSPTRSSCGSSAAAVGSKARIVHWPASLVLALARATGAVRRDVLLTAEELAGLRASLLVSGQPAARARELQLVGRSQRRSARPRLRLGARAQLPPVRSDLMADPT